MFGIKEETMHFVQNPNLRKRIEVVSTPVANWLINQIENGVTDDVIQSEVRDQYIGEVKKFVAQLKS